MIQKLNQDVEIGSRFRKYRKDAGLTQQEAVMVTMDAEYMTKALSGLKQ